MVAFATQVKRRRGTTAQNDAFTGAEGEIVVDTQRHELRVHDGMTRGGFIIGGDKANVGLDNLTSAGKEVIAHNSMPSDEYTILSIGASGNIYTAPADGYFYYSDQASGPGIAEIANVNTGMRIRSTAPTATWLRATILPVKKGDTVQLLYENGGTNQIFRFIYAEGAK